MDPFDMQYPARVAATAARLDEVGRALRERAARLTGTIAGCRWDGAGARSFRVAAETALARLRIATGDVEAAAAALRRHAAAVGDELDRQRADELRRHREDLERLRSLLHAGPP